MKLFRLTPFLFLLILASSFGKGKEKRHPFDPKRIFTVEELQEDFRALRKDIEKRQPNLYLYTPKERMDFVFDSLYKDINHPMDFYEFYFHITGVLSFIKDGHNLIAPGTRAGRYHDKNAKFLPFHISCIDGKMYSDMNCSQDSLLRDGSEILSINGTPAQKLRAEFLERMVRDGYNETLPDWVMNVYFRGFYDNFYGFPEQFVISYSDPDGVFRIDSVPAERLDTINKIWGRKYAERVKFQKKRWCGLSFRFDSLSKIPIMRIQSFDPTLLKKGYHQKFKKTVDAFFEKIDSAKSETLILDVRDNNGGDPMLAVYLLRRLMNEPFTYAEKALQTRRFNPGHRMSRLTRCKVYGFGTNTYTPVKKHFGGKLIVLINGGSFSATGELASVLRRYKRATFIGEETGGNPVICGGQMFKHSLVLPNTGINCLTGTEATILADLKTNNGHGTMPDYFVHNSIEDILANKDAEMNFALELAEGKK